MSEITVAEVKGMKQALEREIWDAISQFEVVTCTVVKRIDLTKLLDYKGSEFISDVVVEVEIK